MPGGLVAGPDGGLMSQSQPLAVTDVADGVIAHHVSAAEGAHADTRLSGHVAKCG